jgi:predicted RNA-binding Zn ribbon-like protein
VFQNHDFLPARTSDYIFCKGLPLKKTENAANRNNRYGSLYRLSGPAWLLLTLVEAPEMPRSPAHLPLLGGRLSIDFVNAAPPNVDLSWERLIHFLNSTGIVSSERAAQLLGLPQIDPQAAESLLLKARRLNAALRKAFAATLRKHRFAGEWIEPVNEILRITEGHDELVGQDNIWKIEFVAREGGLAWLLAAVARSGAEIIAEGTQARLRLCANPHCGLFFYDDSRTRRRRWCSMAVCGNRSKVAAFARKHASARFAS